MIVHLNGWPGVGKKAIGEKLARRLGARFIHNHLLHDVAIACAGIGDPGRWPLYEEIRRAAYDALAARPREEVFVMTNALCAGAPHEQAAWSHVTGLAMRRGARLVPVVLEAELTENERRLQAPDRIGRKLTDPAVLRSFTECDTIQKPDVPELLVLDVTKLLPDEAVEAIRHHLSLIL